MKKGVTMTLSYQTASRKDKENLGKLGINGRAFRWKASGRFDKIGRNSPSVQFEASPGQVV